ncbi:MAG: Ldh family oxidoreductase [Akkermansiaceae bacterium]|nr:Ldh family oxidoreductase [Armatimonadota bacterium]
MNRPPDEYRTVLPDLLRRFVSDVFVAAGMRPEQSSFLSDLLVTNDLRGVFSHGTRQVAAYVEHFRAERLTPIAEVTTVQESPATLVLDGGGGLGYFPCYEAVTRLVPKAKSVGIAVATTRNHGHFGAAGIYARVPIVHDLFCFVTSGHQLDLQPDQFVMRAAGGSPMAFGIPTGDEPPFVLDFGAIHDLYGGPDKTRALMEIAPSTVLRSFGLGCACQALGGLLCGIPLDPNQANRTWSGANQGSFLIVVDIAMLLPTDQFRREMDAYARAVRRMMPLPGFEKAYLPGGVEWEQEQWFARDGIPVRPKDVQALEKLAEEYRLVCPAFTRPDTSSEAT